jgi:hypothetical protein
LENFSVEYIIPHSRWDQSVGWAGWVANIVPDAFMQENPNGFRMLYAHSAGVDATNSSLKEAKRKRMYDDLNLLNGRTDVQSLRKNLKKQGYEWWRVKVFTAKGDLPAMSPLKILPWLKYEGSLSNYDAAASGAGTAWVHLHCLDDVGHSGLRDSIEANGTEVALPFQVNLGALGKWDNIVRTVPEMMLMDWSSFLAQH